MYRIVMNTCYDMLRDRRRRDERFTALRDGTAEWRASEATPDSLTEDADLLEHVTRLSAALPPAQRSVFMLRDLQDLSVRDTADVLEMSEGAVKSNLCLARKFLRARLAPLLEKEHA
jgi:RNA polymerase sigma-70 factor (ECF subfamily)